jgi:hypothetical protein
LWQFSFAQTPRFLDWTVGKKNLQGLRGKGFKTSEFSEELGGLEEEAKRRCGL